MKLVRPAIFLALMSSSLLAVDPAKSGVGAQPVPPSRTEGLQQKKVAIAAATAAAEFNRLSASHPEWKALPTPEAALDALAASGEKVTGELKPEVLTESRAEVLEWLVLKEGRLTGTAALNQLFHNAKPTTVGARARRNAQSLISTFNASQAAGSPASQEANSVVEAVELVRKGVMGGGAFAGSFFQAPMEAGAAVEAMTYITFADGVLHYMPKEMLSNENEPVPVPPAPDVVQLVEMKLKQEQP
jgi:hypothetical protein